MRRWILRSWALSFLLAGAAAPASAAGEQPPPGLAQYSAEALQQISPSEIREMIDALSAPRFGGRLTGTPKFRQMVEYLAGWFKTWDVSPGAEGRYLQSWPVSYTVIGSRSKLALIEGGSVTEYVMYQDYMPALFTATAKVEAPAVFVGYGITSPEQNYDDYKSVDVRSKLVLVIKGIPTPDVGRWSKYDDHAVRMKNARDHGAAGAIYIYVPVAVPKGLWQAGFPVALVSRKLAEGWFAGPGRDLAEVTRRIAETGEPLSFETGRTFRIETEGTHFPKAEGLNLIGYIEGSDPALRREAVVIGAHIDGCGEDPELMPGAFDNASGTATMMQVAKAFARSASRPERSVWFVGFGGEEMGKLGSQYFVAHTPGLIARTVAMINLDMTGVGDAIRVAGGERYPELAEMAARGGGGLGAEILRGELTIPPNSDYGPFMECGIPVLGITSSSTRSRGGPMRGHTPRDTTDQINPEIAAAVARLVFRAAYQAASR